jgi:hypothetical protein
VGDDKMDALAQRAGEWPSPLAWLREFLKEELAPYPGREALVARMVVATTVVMIINMIYRVPYGAYGAVYALTISREDPRSTVIAVKTIVVAFALAAADVLIGAMLFSGNHSRVCSGSSPIYLPYFSPSARRRIIQRRRASAIWSL